MDRDLLITDIACRMCGATRVAKLFEESPAPGFTVSVVKCCECGIIATAPQPDPEFLTNLYDTGSYKQNTVSGSYCLDEKISSADFTPILSKLERLTPAGKLLDVGCGMGNFLNAALAAGWDAHGVEPSPYASKLAIDRFGDRVRNELLSTDSFPKETFDAITIWYVLEHVPDPKSVLETANTLLRPGGKLFVAVPNWNYIRIRRHLISLFIGHPGSVHAHEHLYQYTSCTLRNLLVRTNFEYISENCATPYYVSGKLINIAKHIAGLGTKALFATTGINMGGILVFAQKRI